MIVIASAAYVDSELQSEFGRLPPSFLPVGNLRLFQRQLRVLSANFPGEQTFLSLPESYVISQRDTRALQSASVQVIRVPDDLSLADSVLFVINVIGSYGEGVRLLHGDTLIFNPPHGWDCVAISHSVDDYDWHVDDMSPNTLPQVWCGYFSFSSTGQLAKYLVASRGDFEAAVSAYDAAYSLERVHTDQWLDLGHVNTFYRSRGRITTQREFNSLTIKDHCVHKTGHPTKKIQAEAHWFANLPPNLRTYIPQLLRHGDLMPAGYYYELEYMYLAPLNELYVHGSNSSGFWIRVFKHLSNWFRDSRMAVAVNDNVLTAVRRDANGMLAEKTPARLEAYLREAGLDASSDTTLNGTRLPSLSHVLEHCLESAGRLPVVPGILHGDLCFSNILYDTRADRIKIIDPRGLNYLEELSLVGDLRYDLAKLSHSVLGLYDFIIGDAFEVDNGHGLDFQFNIHADDNIRQIQKTFEALPLVGDLTARDVAPITIMLFLSMLPLHRDTPRRQRAMLANALRLFSEMDH